MADDNSGGMRANLGLGATGGSFSPVGTPTPGSVNFPTVRHPGEVSVQAVQMATMQTMQVAQQATRAGGMSFGGGSPLSAFAQQYQANQAGIAGNQFNPYYAQMMTGGGRGFMPGMMPSATHMTDPSMGIFRQFPQGPASMVPPVPQLPLFRHPLTPSLPHPSFQSPLDYQFNIGRQRGDQFTAAALATPGLAAQVGVDVGGGLLGSGLGAALGARFGGGLGARFGGVLGGIAGVAGAELSGLSGGVGGIVNALNPMRGMALRGAQLQSISNDFVVGGSNMGANGRGLSAGSAVGLGRMMEDIGYSGGFRKETGFSVQDLTKITRLAGDQGILDMAQSSSQIKTQVTAVARALKNFMQLAGEPDIAEAMRSIGQMRSMGLGTGEAMRATQSSRMFARMAGTSVAGLSESGLQGAMVFQQAGLTAGLGLQMGHGAMGMARQSVAAGMYTPQQLALLGGTSGIAQRDMQANAAFLKMPMLTAAMSSMGAGGAFGINGRSIEGMMSGKLNINQMASMGVDNLMSAVNRGGVGALATFQMQQSELQDGIGRALGPTGMKIARMRQVMATQKMLDVSGPGGFALAGKVMGMSDEEIRQMSAEANSPEFFSNLRRQHDAQIQDVRMQEEAQTAATAPGILARMRDSGGLASGGLREVGRIGGAIRGGFRDALEFGTAAIADMGTNYGNRTMFRTADSMLATSPGQARAVAAMSDEKRAALRAGLMNRANLDDQGALVTIGGQGYGYNRVSGVINAAMGGDMGAMRAVRQAQGGLRGILGGGYFERGARMGLIGLRLEGSLETEGDILERGKAYQRGSEIMYAGKTASGDEMDEASARIAKALGGDTEKAAGLQEAFAAELAAMAKGRERDTLVGDVEQFDDASLQKALDAAKKKIGAKGNVSLKDVSITSLQTAQTLAGDAGQGAFRTNSMDEIMNGVRTGDAAKIKAGQLGLTKELMGNTGISFGRGRTEGWDSTRLKAMDAVFSGSTGKVNAAAALYAALEEAGGKDSAIESKLGALKLTGRERQEALAKVKSMKADGLDSELSGIGKTLSTRKGDVADFMQSASDVWMAGKEKDGTKERLFGGTKSAAERGLEANKAGLSSLEKELGTVFPQAVDVFRKSAIDLSDAARRLGNGGSGMLSDAVPDGG